MDVDTTSSENPAEMILSTTEELIEKRSGESSTYTSDTPDVPVRFAEKKRLHWSGKTCE